MTKVGPELAKTPRGRSSPNATDPTLDVARKPHTAEKTILRLMTTNVRGCHDELW
jgi:hypothetical protein